MAINRRGFLNICASSAVLLGCGHSSGTLSADDTVIRDAISRLQALQGLALHNQELQSHLASHIAALVQLSHDNLGTTPEPTASASIPRDLHTQLSTTSITFRDNTLAVTQANLSRAFSLISASLAVHAVALGVTP